MPEQTLDPERVRREQREYWNAAAPGWKQMFILLDRAAQHVSDRLVELAKIKPGDQVLDIATGSGEPGITAARKVGASGGVIATDMSPGMLALARDRAAALGVTNIKFVETGAESLAVDGRDFNAIVCRWGLMFVPDLNLAARRIYELLASGGRLATAVWSTPEKVPMISLGEDATRELAKLPPPPPGAPHPLRLADNRPLLQALEAAGFKDVALEPLNVAFEWESASAFTEQRRVMSAAFRALLAHQPPELEKKILEAVTNAARKYADSTGKVRMNNETICISARR